MADFVTLSCPSCGGKLEITNDVERFACSHCGREQIVKRSGGIVSLSPVVDALNRVSVGVDKTAAELALVRLQKEIDGLQVSKVALLQSSPQPTPKPIFLIVIIFGFVLSGVAVYGMLNHETGMFALLICGLVPLVIGALSLFLFMSNRKTHWEKTTGAQLKSFDEQIAIRYTEIRRYQDIVSQ